MAEEEALEAEQDLSVAVAMPDGAAPSAFACPDCGGVLWEVTDAALARFRCRVGHVYTPEGLSSAQSGAVDDALWVAFRALEESAALNERLAHRAAERGLSRAAEQYRARLADAKSRAKLLRDVLYRGRLDRGTSAIEPESTVKRPGP